jgi:iron complex transport system ATP-binding protein
MLSAREITVERGGRPLLVGASVDVHPGRTVAVLGPNGAGKSTLLRALSREWPVARGTVTMDGVDSAGLSAAALARRRAVVPQATAMPFPFTVLGVVMLGATVPGFGLAADTSPALAALAAVGLTGFEDRPVGELSGGERQRVAIARALCQLDTSPDIRSPVTRSRAAAPSRTPSAGAPSAGTTAASRFLLLDEPTASLDPAHQVMVLNLLRARAERGIGIVVVLHDINLAAAWADDVVLIGGGRIQAVGGARDVLDDRRLSALYGCRMRVNTVPPDGAVFVLPHHHRRDAAA